MSLVIDISVSRVDYLLTVQARRIEDRTPGRDVDGRPKCPHCGAHTPTPTQPTLTGKPVYMCTSCKHISLREDW